jgi:8-oxo-dGTP diphosphatase
MAKKFGAGILLINSNNELLMLLRDDRPDIPFPNMWDIPGGHIEPGEIPEETIKREMVEEMNLELGDINLFKVYYKDNLVDNVFWKKIDLNPDLIDLKEGQRIAYFSYEQLSKMKLAFDYNSVIDEFFSFISASDE